MIARRFTMVAYVERNGMTGKDAWNMPLPGVFQAHAEVPCFAWTPSSRDVVDGHKSAIVQDVRMMFALGIDVSEGDQIAKITDRKGTVLFTGPMRVEGSVDFKHNHHEAALVRVG